MSTRCDGHHPTGRRAILARRRRSRRTVGNLKRVVNWHWKGNKLHTPSGIYHAWANVMTKGKTEGDVVRWEDGETVVLGKPADGGPRSKSGEKI